MLRSETDAPSDSPVRPGRAGVFPAATTDDATTLAGIALAGSRRLELAEAPARPPAERTARGRAHLGEAP